MDDLQKLSHIIGQVGPDNVWRPVYTPGKTRLAKGAGNFRDGLPMNALDFQGKTVVDMGCNFGFYSFLVGYAGAAHVTGVDIDSRIIEGCRILKRLYKIDTVSFLVADITRSPPIGKFDTGMMVDFIGKSMVADGSLRTYLDVLEKMSQEEMIVNVRPAYKIAKHLGSDFRGLLAEYPREYVGKKYFHTLAYVQDRFGSRWDMQCLCPPCEAVTWKKKALRFTRKSAA